jgi:hypothetical protein
MQQIRVCTYDGPGAQPVIRTVPWPTIPKKAALIKVGTCGDPFSEEGIGKAVADAMAMKTMKSTIVPWPELVE